MILVTPRQMGSSWDSKIEGNQNATPGVVSLEQHCGSNITPMASLGPGPDTEWGPNGLQGRPETGPCSHQGQGSGRHDGPRFPDGSSVGRGRWAVSPYFYQG